MSAKKNIYGENVELVSKKKPKKKLALKSKTSKNNSKSASITNVVKSNKDIEASVQDFFNSIKPKPEYIKHLVQCKCILPQYSTNDSPPIHKFVVFSELDEKANIKPSYAQCNNCGVVHKVLEVGTSVTINKESLSSLPTIEDLKTQMPEWIVTILSKYSLELHSWQEAKFIIENELWGRFVVLSKDIDNDLTLGKIIQIFGNNLYKIETFERNEYASL